MYVCAGARVAHARPVSAYIYIFISVNYLFLLLFCLYSKRAVCFCSGCPVRFQSSQIGACCMPGGVPGVAGPVSVLCRAVPGGAGPVPVCAGLSRSCRSESVLCRSCRSGSVLCRSCRSESVGVGPVPVLSVLLQYKKKTRRNAGPVSENASKYRALASYTPLILLCCMYRGICRDFLYSHAVDLFFQRVYLIVQQFYFAA